jgi:GntR family transcriptional repressor for pyruvate dehydrogenase complex
LGGKAAPRRENLRGMLAVMVMDQAQPPENLIPVATQIRASDIAERYIRSLIFSGQLAPGDRLPSERDLAVQLGISRVTLRIALRSLEALGFIGTTLGSKGGSRVNDEASIRAKWEEWIGTHRHLLAEMLEFRRLIDIEIASLAAQRRTSEDIDRMERILAARPDGGLQLVRSHFSFHDALAKAARNRYLEQAMVSIRDELFVPVEWASTASRVIEMERLHERMLDAIRAGDPVRAAEETKKLVEFAARPFRAALES